jgi:hypothetical protein
MSQDNSVPRVSGESTALHTPCFSPRNLAAISGLQNCRTSNDAGFSTSLWSFVMAALGKANTHNYHVDRRAPGLLVKLVTRVR